MCAVCVQCAVCAVLGPGVRGVLAKERRTLLATLEHFGGLEAQHLRVRSPLSIGGRLGRSAEADARTGQLTW